MTGFRNFILRGNLVDLAVGVIIGVAFGAVVKTFTEWLTHLLPGGFDKVFGDAKEFTFGAFMNALIAFLIMAAVVYFFVVVPYIKAKEKFFPTKEEDAGKPADIALLEEIRDLLATRNQA